MNEKNDLTFLNPIMEFAKNGNNLIYTRLLESIEYLNELKKLNSELLLNILNYDDSYIIFLSSRYFSFPRKYLLKYFRKKKILYFEYEKKEIILWLFQAINFYIDNANDNDKENFRIKYKINKKIKVSYFLDNNIEPDTLYKMLYFSKEDIYIPFDFYLLKKIEYKLKSICQISEKLGANKIDILYTYSSMNETILGSSLSIQGNDIGGSITNKNNQDQTIKLTFEYQNSHNTFNLNKNYLEYLISTEDHFIVSYDEYKTDIDLKYLINARCINLVQKYSTNLLFNSCSEFERKLLIKSQYFGLELSQNLKKNKIINLTIDIDFLDIYKYTEYINGLNLYIGKEGYQHLIRTIIYESNKNENDMSFLKLNNFMFENIKYNYDFYNDECIKLDIKPYNKEELFFHVFKMIENNFSDELLNYYYKEYFKNNQTFFHFLELAYALCGIYKINKFKFFNKEKYYLKPLFPFFLIIYQYNSLKYGRNIWNTLLDTNLNHIYEQFHKNQISLYGHTYFNNLSDTDKYDYVNKKDDILVLVKKFYFNEIIFTNASIKYKYINNIQEFYNFVMSYFNENNTLSKYMILLFWSEVILKNTKLLFKIDRDQNFILRLLEDYFMDKPFIHTDMTFIDNFNLFGNNFNSSKDLFLLEYINKKLPYNYYNIKNKGIYFTFNEFEILKNDIEKNIFKQI